MAILHFHDFKEIMVPNYIVIKISFIYGFDNMYKVKLDFKNHQDKHQLGFKNSQIFEELKSKENFMEA